MREWIARLRDRLRRERLDEELAEELRFHRDQLERDARAAGAAPAEAADQARRRLGSETRAREESRERWSFRWLDVLQQDLRYALRGLRRSPAFTVTVVLTLALGIGADAAMYGVVDRLMFRPFPYLRAPGSVHRVYLQHLSRGTLATSSEMPYPRYLDLRRWTRSFDLVVPYLDLTLAVGVGDAARDRRVAVVGADFFDLFDAPPARGRYFTAAEDATPKGAAVAVLSHAFWQAHFAGRDVLGTVLRIDNVAATIIGITPPGFSGVNDGRMPVAYLPITTYAGATELGDSYYADYDWTWMETLVRRRPGVTIAQASADLSRAYARSWDVARRLRPEVGSADSARARAVAGALRPGGGPDPGLEARTAAWLMGVAVVVLIIACANVANLLLARALRRRRETAVRLALGVSRGRLVRQSLTEGLVLALIGGAAGLLVAQWGGLGIRRLLITGRDASLDLLTDGRTIGVTAAAAVMVGLVTGLVPALLATRGDLTGALKAGAREGGGRRSRSRSALLVTQCALTAVLLVGAGLFVRSLERVRAMRLGYDADSVLVAGVNLRGMTLDGAARIALGRDLLAAAQAIPGVASATWVSSVPFSVTSVAPLHVEGVDSVGGLGRFTYQTATSDYFRTMGTRIVRGRGFTAADGEGAPPIAVVSEGMAAALWPGRDALGRCLRVGRPSAPCRTVVGIAEDMVQRDLAGTRRYHYYLPLAQYSPEDAYAVLLRMRGDPAPQVEAVRKALQARLPGDAYVRVSQLGLLVDGARRSWRLGATLFAAFGLLALLVAAVGLYGVLAYDVTQRTHELGVRVALGARTASILRLVVGQGVWLTALGVGVGAALAMALGRWIQPLLFRQSARDPVVLGLVAAVLLVVALAASAAPALRAMAADPNSALRAE